MKIIKIRSLKKFYQVVQDPDFDRLHTIALISLSYPVDEDRLCGVRSVVCQYDDIDRDVMGRCFTRVEANKFARFFKSYEKETTTIFSICDGGCRRSAAVAAALFRFYGRDDEEIRRVWQNPAYEPNPLVFRLMAFALGAPVDDFDLDLRIWENRNAIRERIKGGNL